MLVPGIIVTLLPDVLLRQYRTSASRLALWGFAGLAWLILLWFGVIDGFLDHV